MLPAAQSPPPNNRETANAPGRDESSLRNFLRGISVFRVEREKDHGSILQVRIQGREERH